MDDEFTIHRYASLAGIPFEYISINEQGVPIANNPPVISNFHQYADYLLLNGLSLPETLRDYPEGITKPISEENLQELRRQWEEGLRTELNKSAYFSMGIGQKLRSAPQNIQGTLSDEEISRFYLLSREVYDAGYRDDRFFFSQPQINTKSYLIVFQNILSGQDIFNRINTSEIIKAVHYFSGQHDLFKIHVDVDNNPLLSKKWLRETHYFEQDTRYVHLVLSENFLIKLDLQEGNFLVEHANIEKFIQEILEVLPIQVTEIKEIGLGGHVDLFGININPVLFADFLTVNDRRIHPPGWRFFIYYLLNDRSVLHGNVELDIRLGGNIVARLTLSNGRVAANRSVITDHGNRVEFPDNYNFIRIYFSRVIDEVYLRFSRFFLRALLLKYLSVRDIIQQSYQYANISGFLQKEEISDYIGIPDLTDKHVDNRKILKKIFPNLFVSGYARCGCITDRQPYISEQDPGGDSLPFDIKNNEGVPVHRIYFHCDPKKKYSKVDLKQNTVLPNRTIYPQIPCCFQPRAIPKGKSSGQIVTTQYLIQPGTTAHLINDLAYVLQSIFAWQKLLRFGLPETTDVNSVLYGLHIATETKGMPSNLLKYEQVVQNIRSELANTYPVTAKAELYDHTLSEITALLANPTYFLDLREFISLFQHYFQVNVVMFNRNPDDNYLELPRGYAKHGYFNFYPGRPTVMFFYNSKQDRADLFFAMREKKNIILQLSPEESDKMARFVQNLRGVLYMDRFLQDGELFLNLVELYSQEFSKIAKNQWLDHRGMCRMINIIIEGEELRTIIVMPIKPLHCEALNEPQINSWNLSEVMQLFADHLQNFVLDDSGQCVGFWLRWGNFSRGIYLPINPSDPPKLQIRQSINNPVLDITGHGGVVKIDYMEKIARVILQITAFLFTIFVKNNTNLSEEQLIEQFANLYLTIGDDAYYSYDISDIRINFPDVMGRSVGDLIKAISEYLPTFFSGGKLFLSTDKIYQGIKFYLSLILHNHGKYNLAIPKEIQGILTEARDFHLDSRELLFMSRIQMLQWGTANYTNPIIHYKLDFESMLNKEPFFFQQRPGMFFLIQNVRDGVIYRAYKVGHHWANSAINLGYDADYYSGEIAENSYTILKINKKLTLSKDLNNRSRGNILLLQYTDTVWAAVLPLPGKNVGL